MMSFFIYFSLKELGYTTINENNFTEVLEKITEIESRKMKNHA